MFARGEISNWGTVRTKGGASSRRPLLLREATLGRATDQAQRFEGAVVEASGGDCASLDGIFKAMPR